MNSEQETINLRREENELNLSDLFHIVLANWYWFVLSVLVCAGVAVLYLKWAPKVYTRTASVLIKDNSKGGGLSESAAFEELNMFNVKSNVDNEVLVFKSKRLMSVVAERLNLDISYTIKDGLRTEELYTQSPIAVRFPEAEASQSFSLVATPLSAGEILLSGFSTNEAKSLKVALNDTVSTPVGKLVVTPTLYYADKYFGKAVTISKRNREEIALTYSNSLQVALASKTATIINLTLQDVSIPRAEDVLNMLIAVYNEDAINDKNQVTVNTSNFINDRLIIIEEELGSVDADIETYKRENQLTDISSETGMYLQESSQYSKEGLGLENQVTLAKYIRDYLTDPHKSSDLIPANTGIADVNIEGQISEYNNLLLKRDKLIGNSSNKNPVVMDLNNSLSAMKQTIIRAIDNLIVGLNIKIKNIREREAQTSRRISAVPTQQKYVLSVERQQKIKEELYLYLLNKREENALSQAITESNARVIDAAQGSRSPVAPKSMMILLAAVVLGLAIPAGIIWLQMVMNTTVRTRKDVEDAVSIPFLGEIPLRDKKNKDEIVVRENGRDSISEAFRIVRTNMDFMRVKAKDMKVVMFTSFNPNAGKTFVSMNLAMSFALTRKKVILVDLDIRKGTLSGHVSGTTNMGITNYLSGKVDDINSIIKKEELATNLDIIHTGPVPPNPSELLLSDRLEALIEELKKRYDYIILDNVPAGLVADAAIVNRVADLTIYILRAGLMDRRQLPELEKLYRQGKFRNMSLVLNGVRYNRSGYGYG
ncbi:GumC family protein, partial [Parabacteroides goldsteinii]